ncbi:Na(+)/H(+) antiporter subunit C [Cryobacterium sp. TMS1-20-1]|uniref:Multicomponent Na+:H+ antiporter subunit C n=1 Tax=Cryobacterium levicorallinum TaxID=995038 RepID=A0A1I3ATM9_9MICO|nr:MULTISPECIES: NADH-quinone oxidoreductase subunit K [Cryobacterium]TFB87992.1 Na(+)/H(+) antiporter subunit C [Cryobacterium levicorallinum]TFC81848.1 Na(+)/H(+) antiporter subunit C [Cryobacterium sp. TMS1-20-1]TFD49260.1 Na(+)/H(+) antiporter subunit C [Cryobacterium sp. Hh11]TFD56369.1 Na(+)/H(+) antiporter subunit C [Cryobacterium sp. Hh38]TFD57456.1 Na(+)/H(+) antiporter subunit C [Cryobacterium sp. Hh7]
MSASLTLVIVMAVMYAAGVYVMLERSLTRVLIGFLLVGNATNLLIFIMSGRPGSSPIVTGTSVQDMVDPIPQVLMLTAIVINFGITALLLALIYRSWWLAQLGDEGDTLTDEHATESAGDADATFRSSSDDDDAIAESIDEFERGDGATSDEDTSKADAAGRAGASASDERNAR